MDAVTAWFDGQAERERRSILLEDALLAGRFGPYVVYRLRFWLARYGLASVVQVGQVLILHRLFPREGFLVLVGLLAAAALISAGWWGVLEVLRARVRDLSRAGSPHLIPAEIGRWLSGALRIGLVGVVGAAGFLVWRALSEPPGPGPVDVAAASILIRIAVDLPRRCYHAGIYALRRVYRPLPSILALDVVSVGALLALVPWLGPWAAPVAELIAVAVVTSISVTYTARTYRLAGFAPHRHLRGWPFGRGRRRATLRRPGGPAAETVRAAIPPAAAAAVMSLDSIVVLGVFAAVDARAIDWPFALLVAAAAPSVRAGFDWSQLLYFDLKRLERRPFANLRATFIRRATILAPVLGVGFWAVGWVVATIVLGPVATDLMIGLLPFFVASSLLALGQMDAFSSGAYRPVVASGIVFAAGLIAIGPLASLGIGPVESLDLAVILALLTLALMRRSTVVDGASGGDLLPSGWLHRLGRERGPLLLGTLRVDAPGRLRTPETQRADAWRSRRLIRRIADRLGPSGVVAGFGEATIAWYERIGVEGRFLVGRPARVDGPWLLQTTGGRFGHLRTDVVLGGASALGMVAGWGLDGLVAPGGPPSRRASSRRRGERVEWSGRDALLASFWEAFPGGLVVEPDRPPPMGLRGLSARERRFVLAEALRHARGLAPVPGRLRFDVTTWCPAGALELIFLVERSRSRRSDRAAWRILLRDAHLDAALEVAASPTPDARRLHGRVSSGPRLEVRSDGSVVAAPPGDAATSRSHE